MKQSISLFSPVAILALVIWVSGCGSKPADPSPSASSTGSAKPSEGGHGHGHGGEEHALAEWTGGGWTVKATQVGEIEAKHEMVFELAVSGGEAKSIRGWVGGEKAEGAVGKAEKEGDGWDLHLEGLAKVDDHAKLWLEIEGADGKKTTASIALNIEHDHGH